MYKYFKYKKVKLRLQLTLKHFLGVKFVLKNQKNITHIIWLIFSEKHMNTGQKTVFLYKYRPEFLSIKTIFLILTSIL
tara:strand:+ start:36 stop:269 length:234 start_codon:yes stop_codon:yes gene_type:complete